LIVANEEKQATGEIYENKTLITQLIIYLIGRGNKESTIERRIRYLKELVKSGANLRDPESVKKALAEKNWVGRSKNNAADTYTLFLKMLEKKWDKPHYQEVRKIPFIPTEAEIDVLIAACRPKTATYLQLLKETAMRPGEAVSLTWDDVDFISKTIRVTPEKGSNPRIFRASDKLLKMLLDVKSTNHVKDPNRIFAKQLRHVRRYYEITRKKLAYKLKNPRIKKIMLKTFRTWKATMLYHETKDPWYVTEFLGHTSLQHTKKYVQLERALFKDVDDSYICKVVNAVEEASGLIEVGFEYVNEINGSHLYRKRK